ncbi:hypothetical protein TCAL_14613 [Tigriopus californicus]|uniref:Cyclin-dependent kinase 20 n=1 Tax=Tigriopus californicus TaxID=6832 RepID=A0A553PB78_TIGCA|nr:hypothetical protein TCAL_14613 [Tigriopus californicus]
MWCGYSTSIRKAWALVLVFEYMMSDLSELIQCVDNPLSEPQTKTYMIMLLRGTEYMHSMNIMHRDLKPANLLISADGLLKNADLGLSRVFTKNEKRPYFTSSGHPMVSLARITLRGRENDIDQLGLVIRTMGTPMRRFGPESQICRTTRRSLSSNHAIPLENLVPDAPSEAQALFKRFIKYDSKKRCRPRSGRSCPAHPERRTLHRYVLLVPPFPALNGQCQDPSKDPDSK